MNSFSDFNINPDFPLKGTKESIGNVKNKPIIIRDFKIIQIKDEHGDLVSTCQIQFNYETETVNRLTFTRSKVVKRQLGQFDKSNLPVSAKFKEKDGCLYLE